MIQLQDDWIVRLVFFELHLPKQTINNFDSEINLLTPTHFFWPVRPLITINLLITQHRNSTNTSNSLFPIQHALFQDFQTLPKHLIVFIIRNIFTIRLLSFSLKFCFSPTVNFFNIIITDSNFPKNLQKRTKCIPFLSFLFYHKIQAITTHFPCFEIGKWASLTIVLP